MEFSLDRLDIIQDSVQNAKQSTLSNHHRIPHSNENQSTILDDLTNQIEDLQNKLKLNYRKLLLFETENQKLIQEKNKLYFEVKNYHEKLDMMSEKNEKLEQHTTHIENQYKLSHEKHLAFEKLCETQSVDLKRLSKFHLKIKEIIKPYVQSLKNQITSLQSDLQNAKQMSASFEKLNAENIQQIQQLKQQYDLQKNKSENEKTNFIQSYEEQIHFLSKEILQYQQKNETLESEIFKQKKMNENKNFIENELIRFKRLQESDQAELNTLKLKNLNLENSFSALQNQHMDLKNKMLSIETENHQLSQNIEATRQQLVQKMDELEKCHLRLKMLEKLNTNLSLSFTNQNTLEPQKES
jgi:chromosome segregation ATPase